MRGVVLANEVLDALPVQRFVVRGGVARELGVGLVGGGFGWQELPAKLAADGFAGQEASAEVANVSDVAAVTDVADVDVADVSDVADVADVTEVADAGDVADVTEVADAGDVSDVTEVADAGDVSDVTGIAGAGDAASRRGVQGSELVAAADVAALPDGYTSEVCTRVDPWIAGVGQCLARGALLLFDYGLPRAHYYHPQRVDGTLRCYFKQRAHDNPFINIGVQDITAWVDFTRVADAALGAGMDVTGFVTQAAFLLGNGIEAMTMEVTDVATRARLAGEARRLLMPGEMGESFKVMALCRDLEVPLRGFAYQDLRGSL
jgi:SAM-dependent MidA family methyltransferase